MTEKIEVPRDDRPTLSIEQVAVDWIQTKLEAIENLTGKDVLTICGPIIAMTDAKVRMAIEKLREKRETLLVILYTGGGYVEEVRNIVQVIRHHYKEVHFLIPVHAMSAGTVLVMSGDKIYMDYFSRLGPIDPQVPINNGERSVPVRSYKIQFERLMEKSKKENLTTPEFTLLNKLDLAELHQMELAGEHSVSLIKGWLMKYKFKNLSENGVPATPQRKEGLAREIAETLNDHERWYTHGNSIHKDVLEEMGLKVDDYSEEKGLKEAVWMYFWPMLDYAGKLGTPNFVQAREYI